MEPLVDTTEPLALTSKKTKRLTRKLEKQARKRVTTAAAQLLDLPVEIILR
jgi:hypothetical protein